MDFWSPPPPPPPRPPESASLLPLTGEMLVAASRYHARCSTMSTTAANVFGHRVARYFGPASRVMAATVERRRLHGSHARSTESEGSCNGASAGTGSGGQSGSLPHKGPPVSKEREAVLKARMARGLPTRRRIAGVKHVVLVSE